MDPGWRSLSVDAQTAHCAGACDGQPACGAGARKILGRKGRELMSILCEAADSRVFNVMLTPHFNRAHRDHVHLEIKADVKWFLVH